MTTLDNITCPAPNLEQTRVLLAHGGGGTLMHRLVQDVFLSRFSSTSTADQHDAATLCIDTARLAFTTDSFVVKPLIFPGGDIGALAVHGTVNDLAMSGARPLYLSAGFILEEGLEMPTLNRIAESMHRAATEVGVEIVTGDTKVVDRGKGDGVFINTAGIGRIEHPKPIMPSRVQPGDAILVSGDLGRHGIAIMARREGLEFETTINSDSAPVVGQVMAMLDAGIDVHCLRDLTRGGLASALNEIAAATQLAVNLEEDRIPVRHDVRGACEILGLDPLYVACEGRFVAFVPEHELERAVTALSGCGASPRQIGLVQDGSGGRPGRVTIRTTIGATRIVDMLTGEQLPRIC